MKLSELESAIFNFLKSIRAIGLNEISWEASVGWDQPFVQSFRKDMPYEGYKDSSGIYFITDMGQEVLYIGKATAGNLGAEIWGKFCTFHHEKIFSKSKILSNTDCQTTTELISSGNFFVRAIRLEPNYYASLVEVYAQTYFFSKCKKLPILNKRVG